MGFDPNEWEIVDSPSQASGGFDPSAWEIVDPNAKAPLTGMEALAGGFTDIANALSANAGDKIIGAGAGLTDYLGNKLAGALGYDVPDLGLIEASTNRTQQIGDLVNRYQEEHPISSLFNKVAVFKTPLPGDAITRTGAQSIAAGKNAAKLLPMLEMSKAKGVLPALANIGKGAAVGAGLGGTAGLLGGATTPTEERLSNAQSGAGQGAAFGGIFSTLAEGAQGIFRKAPSLFFKTPTKDEALLNSFKGKGPEDLEALQALKAQGILNEGILQSKTPYQDVAKAVETGIEKKSSEIGKALDGVGVKTKDIFPNRQMFGDLTAGEVSQTQLSNSLKAEQENIIKDALIKLFPKRKENVEGMFDEYQALWKAATKGDMKAAEKFATLQNKIDNVSWTGNELWKIRQRYDKNINWNVPELKNKAEIYANLRDNLQNRIIDLTGGAEAPVAGQFKDLSNLFGAQPLANKMRDVETTGAMRQGPIGSSILKWAFSPVKTAMKEALKTGGGTTPDPMTSLRQLYGKTAPQWMASRPSINYARPMGQSAALFSLSGSEKQNGGRTIPQEQALLIPAPRGQSLQGQSSLKTESSLNSAPLSSAKQDIADKAFKLLVSQVNKPRGAPETFDDPSIDEPINALLGGSMDTKPQVQVPADEFDSKVEKIAQDLGADPVHLFQVMNFETGGTLDPAQANKAGSGATGLIQFMPETAKELTGADTKEAAQQLMASMTPTEQLDYVAKYLKPFKGKLGSLDDLYMAVLYPKAVGKDSQYALFKKGTKAYWQNRGLDLDKDGVITKSEAAKKVKSYKV